MLIKYNKPNVHALPGPGAKKIHRLMPGWNEFPKKVFELWKKHPQIAAWIEEGTLEFMEESKKEKRGNKTVTKKIGQDDSPLDLKDLSEGKSIKIVKETHNRDLLERWHDAETRNKVKKVLAKQLKPLQNARSEENTE